MGRALALTRTALSAPSVGSVLARTASCEISIARLAQLVERWSHNPKVVSSILTLGRIFL